MNEGFTPLVPAGMDAADSGGDSGEDSDDGTLPPDPTATTGADDATTTGAPPDAPTTGGDDPTDGGEDSSGEPMPQGLPDVGSLVILGDSIGDGGGQSPYYYTLLRDSLSAHYGGAPGGGAIEYVNRADSGSKTGALAGQVGGLPGQLPGPVVVVITSGGNDMKDALPAVATGLDGPILAQVSANIDTALSELLSPGRFGPGVEVHVFEGNVYDASDGAGNYSQGGCNFADGLPAIPTDVMFDRWNDAIATAVEARGQTAVDMHGYFYGHGYNNPPNWYASDCTHPNSQGHDELQRLFFEHITGEALP